MAGGINVFVSSTHEARCGKKPAHVKRGDTWSRLRVSVHAGRVGRVGRLDGHADEAWDEGGGGERGGRCATRVVIQKTESLSGWMPFFMERATHRNLAELTRQKNQT